MTFSILLLEHDVRADDLEDFFHLEVGRLDVSSGLGAVQEVLSWHLITPGRNLLELPWSAHALADLLDLRRGHPHLGEFGATQCRGDLAHAETALGVGENLSSPTRAHLNQDRKAVVEVPCCSGDEGVV